MSVRIRASRASEIHRYFAARGIEVSFGTPSQSLHGGCLDPECCGIHDGHALDGEPMVDVFGVSGSRLHKAILELYGHSAMHPAMTDRRFEDRDLAAHRRATCPATARVVADFEETMTTTNLHVQIDTALEGVSYTVRRSADSVTSETHLRDIDSALRGVSAAVADYARHPDHSLRPWDALAGVDTRSLVHALLDRLQRERLAHPGGRGIVDADLVPSDVHAAKAALERLL